MLRLLLFFCCFLLITTGCQTNEESAVISPQPTLAFSNQSAINGFGNQYAAHTALQYFLKDKIHPFSISQVKGVGKDGFKSWLNQNGIDKPMKAFLQPVLNDQKSEFVILHQVRLKSTNKLTSIAIAGVADVTKPLVNFTDIVILQSQEDDDDDDGGNDEGWSQCQYNSCSCVNSSNCSCTSTTINKTPGEDCPTDECSSDEECGGNGGDEGGNFGIFEVLGAF